MSDLITAAEASTFFARLDSYEDRFTEAYDLLEAVRMADRPDFPDCRFRCGFQRWSISCDGFELHGESWFHSDKDGDVTHCVLFASIFDRWDAWKAETVEAERQVVADKQAEAERRSVEKKRKTEKRELAEYGRLHSKYGAP